MNDVELKAIELKRKAWEVLDGKSPPDKLFQDLHRLERQNPKLLELVAAQMELDNGRWNVNSAIPDVIVQRDQLNRIEAIEFFFPEPDRTEVTACADTISDASQKDNNSAIKIETPLSISSDKEITEIPMTPDRVVWRSDYGDRLWIEDFAKDYLNKLDKD